MLYVLFKKFPSKATDIIRGSNEYLKYLPVDKETISVLNPILDFTKKQNLYNDNEGGLMPILPMGQESRIMNSGRTDGTTKTKRSVSETKKKFVASRQNWKCGDCGEQLSAWFEVDHKVRLEYGGSNHVDNLVALCRECHGRKTTMENL
jgi:5-methylcytosine-specific restriction endonuclease McrA